MTSSKFMQEAILQAKLAFELDEVPVGAVIVLDNKVIAKSHNQNRTKKSATAHAEMLAINQACSKLSTYRLDECDLYVTLEPCLMCATAISIAKISRVYYGLADNKFGAYENSDGIFTKYPSYFKPEIYSNICESEVLKIMQEFFSSKRSS